MTRRDLQSALASLLAGAPADPDALARHIASHFDLRSLSLRAADKLMMTLFALEDLVIAAKDPELTHLWAAEAMAAHSEPDFDISVGPDEDPIPF